MKQTDYAFSVSYVRAIENRLLTKNDIENLIVARSNGEALQILFDKGYTGDISEPKDFELLLSNQFQKSWDEVKEVAPKDADLDILLFKNDFHNYKVILKSITQGQKNYKDLILYPNTINYEDMVKAVAEANFDNLPLMIREVAKESYDVLSRTADSQLCDIIIDRAALDFTLEEAKKSGSKFLEDFVMLQNTLTDIKIAVRCAKTEKSIDFVDKALSSKSNLDRDKIIKAAVTSPSSVYEVLSQNGYSDASKHLQTSMSAFEKYSDNLVTDFIRNARYITFGVEPLIAYIYNKQLEILIVRIIMAARINGFSEENIRERLRDFA